MFINSVKPLCIVHNEFRRNSTYQPVGDFYSGCAVLITGGTGFVGKVFIEKLLYHCEDIRNIYILIRGKKNMSHKERLDEIISQPVFERLRTSKPKALTKLIAVSGDVTLPELGIDPEVAKDIQKEVSVVFHSAATVRFKEKLKTLININVEGTQRVIEFSKKIQDLKVFVYVSTAYSHAQDNIIYEKVYPSPGSIEDLYQYVNVYDDDPVKYAHVLHGRPNAYTQTKALAENLIANSKYEIQLPVLIVRPSISNYNLFGATGYSFFICKGINRVVYGIPDNAIDLIPVDYVANAMIVAAAKYSSMNEEVPVYNICSSYSNPLKIKDLVDGYVRNSRKLKLNDLPLYTITTSSKLLYFLMKLFTELLPALLVNGWLWMWNKEQWYRKSLKYMALQREVQDLFLSGDWIMDTSKSELLAMSLTPEDQEKFQFHAKTIIWDDYLYTYVMGIKHFLFKK